MNDEKGGEMHPLISVIVPVYQVAPYLEHCVESIINQTYHNLEIILVDDGSTDGSGEICDEYADKDCRIEVIHQENRGLSEARNRGIDIARGEYFSFVDSDDWVDERFIEAMYEISVECGCDIVQCGHTNVMDDRECKSQNIGKAVIYSREEYSKAAYTLLGWRCSIAWNKLYKSRLFSHIRYPLGKCHEDEFTTYRLIWEADRIAVIHARLYFYRQRADSIMGKAYSLQRLDAGEAFRERAVFYRNRGYNTLAEMVDRKLLSWENYHLPLLKGLAGNHENIIGAMEREKQCLETRLLNSKKRHSMRFHCYLFPFMSIPQGSDIILYGAGDVGHMYYRQILASDYCNVVLWVDKKYNLCREEGLIVSPVEDIEEHGGKCDFLVIAINNDFVAHEIKSEMIQRYKIDPEKIVYEILEI